MAEVKAPKRWHPTASEFKEGWKSVIGADDSISNDRYPLPLEGPINLANAILTTLGLFDTTGGMGGPGGFVFQVDRPDKWTRPMVSMLKEAGKSLEDTYPRVKAWTKDMPVFLADQALAKEKGYNVADWTYGFFAPPESTKMNKGFVSLLKPELVKPSNTNQSWDMALRILKHEGLIHGGEVGNKPDVAIKEFAKVVGKTAPEEVGKELLKYGYPKARHPGEIAARLSEPMRSRWPTIYDMRSLNKNPTFSNVWTDVLDELLAEDYGPILVKGLLKSYAKELGGL